MTIQDFFSCENDIGRKYVGLSVEDGEGVYVWLYVHISNSRLKDMEAGKIELYDIFKKTEDNFVFEVKTFDVGADKVSKLVCDDISDYLLPHKGTTL